MSLPGGGRGLTTVSVASPEQLLLRHPLLQRAREPRVAPILATIPLLRATQGSLLSGPDVSPGLIQLVLVGRLKAYEVNAEGEELLLELIDAGGFDGLIPAAGLPGHFTQAVQDSLIAQISMSMLESIAAAEPRVVPNLARMISARLLAREKRIQALALQDPRRRLASLLLGLAEVAAPEMYRSGTVVIRRVSHEALGNMLGMRHVAAGLRVRQLVADGAIKFAGDDFVIDVEALRQIVDSLPQAAPRTG